MDRPSLDNLILRAAWVCPIDQAPIENGYVSVRGSKIVALGGWTQDRAQLAGIPHRVQDLGDVALIPSLVNAHTHLEFSSLQQPLGEPGIEFTAWLEQVIGFRHSQLSCDLNKARAIGKGIRESYLGGVGYLGEIATAPVRLIDYSQEVAGAADWGTVGATIFYEQLGRKGAGFNQQVAKLEQFFHHQHPDYRMGVSPHAPYSVHPDLLKMLIDAANRHRRIVAMHLAETEAERELVECRTGPFVDFLQKLGVWDRNRFFPTMSISQWLSCLGRASRALVIHGNYLTASEIELIGRLQKKMAVVFCPRTHRFFGHQPYPLQQLLDQGICVGVGTDSRASNPDLNLFKDLQCISNSFPRLSPWDILKMGTIDGATALGQQDQLGSLTVGKQARFSLLESRDFQIGEADWIFAPSTVCHPVRWKAQRD